MRYASYTFIYMKPNLYIYIYARFVFVVFVYISCSLSFDKEAEFMIGNFYF